MVSRLMHRITSPPITYRQIKIKMMQGKETKYKLREFYKKTLIGMTAAMCERETKVRRKTDPIKAQSRGVKEHLRTFIPMSSMMLK